MQGSNAYCTWQGESGIGDNINILDEIYCNHLPVDSPNTIIAKGDSGASHHYIHQSDTKCLSNLAKNTSFRVTLPNSQLIPSNITGHLDLSISLSSKAQYVAVLP